MPEIEPNYYEILGVASSATDEEIRKSYLKLVRVYHPDTPTGDAEKFRYILAAWRVLGNTKHREVYDGDLGDRMFGSPPIPNKTGVPYDSPYRRVRRWSDDDEHIRQSYVEANEWFERSKRRRAEYLQSVLDEDAADFHAEKAVAEGLRSKTLRWYFVLLLVISATTIFLLAFHPTVLNVVLPWLVLADIAAVIVGSIVSVTLSVRKHRAVYVSGLYSM